MTDKIKCFLGFHNWEWERNRNNVPLLRRRCRQCGRKQKGQYDMSYGCTYWENDHV